MSNLSLAFDNLYPFDSQLSDNQMYFIVSHQNDDGNYQSFKISIDSLAMQLNKIASSGLRSVAYCQSSDFASISHDHDIYTSAMFNPAYINPDDKKRIMTMRTPTTSYEMSLSSAQFIDYVDVGSYVEASPLKLGIMKFIAVNDMTAYRDEFDFSNEKFSGWVKADGTSTYNINDFILSNDIPKVFYTSGSTFTIPLLTSFFKINDNEHSHSYETYEGNLGLPIHNHNLRMSNSSLIINSNKIEVDNDAIANALGSKHKYSSYTPIYQITKTDSDITVSPANSKSYAAGMHDGRNNSDNYLVELAGTTVINDQVLNGMAMFEEEGVNNEIPYPSHNMIPAIVYVGPSRYTDLQRFVSIVQ